MINGISELDLITPDLFPNPASQGGDVRISNIPNFNCTIEITDLQGRLVKTITNSDLISLEGVCSGTFLVNVVRTSDMMILGTTKLVVK